MSPLTPGSERRCPDDAYSVEPPPPSYLAPRGSGLSQTLLKAAGWAGSAPILHFVNLRKTETEREQLVRFCQGSRHCPWPIRARLGIGPPLTKEVDEDAVLGMWIAGRHGAIR